MSRRTGMLEMAMDGVLELLLEKEEFRAPFGQVLTGLASHVFGYEVLVGEIEYHVMSRAVIELEAMDLITVDRYYERRKAKANTLLGVALKQESEVTQ